MLMLSRGRAAPPVTQRHSRQRPAIVLRRVRGYAADRTTSGDRLTDDGRSVHAAEWVCNSSSMQNHMPSKQPEELALQHFRPPAGPPVSH
jgi:hypothetical protein